MGAEGRRSRAAVLVAAIAAASLVAAGCALLVVGEARVNAIPGLAIAVFGTFLTSMAIIAAFSIEEGSRWPTPWESLDRAHVPAWFIVALSSVVTALGAGALDSPFLSAFSSTLALAGIPLGTWALWGLISLSSDRGRWRLVVDLLADSILKSGTLPRQSTGTDLGEIELEDHVPGRFLTAGLPRQPQRTGVSLQQVPDVLRTYADRRELKAVIGLVDEVHAGACAAFERGRWIDVDSYLGSVDALLAIQREAFAELAGRVLSGQLGDATARLAVARAGEAVLDVAGRARRHGPAGAAPGAAPDPRLEALLGRHLTAIARFAGATAQEAEGRLRDPRLAVRRDGEEGAMLALMGVCRDLQQAIRWAVDPHPPGMKLPPDHVWRLGLSDPEAALVWLWSTVESAAAPYGVGLYALCAILTGRKFYESYWDGFDVFTEVARRYAAGAAEDPVAARGLAALERAGGLDTVALELGARRLAAMPPRASAAESFAEDPAHYDDRHVACNLFLAGAGYKPLGRDPVEDLAWLLTDRLHGSLWTTVAEALSELSDPAASPPLRPLHQRSDACAFCLCLRLAPLEAEPDAAFESLRAFLAVLPDPLLERTAALAAALTGVESPHRGAGRGTREAALVEACRFVRRVTPAELPAQERVRLPTAPSAPAAAPRPGDEFTAALAAIAAADPDSPIEVDLVQCDPRWLDQWAAARAELDAALLAVTLRGVAKVRRVVPFDLPPDSPPVPTRLRYRWNDALATAVGLFGRGEGQEPSYEVRLLIPLEAGRGDGRRPADRITVRPAGAGAEAGFESFWARLDSEVDPLDGPGLIEL